MLTQTIRFLRSLRWFGGELVAGLESGEALRESWRLGHAMTRVARLLRPGDVVTAVDRWRKLKK